MMIINCKSRSVLKISCLLVILLDSVLSLPFSDGGVHVSAIAGVWKQDNRTQPNHSELLQIQESDKNLNTDDNKIRFFGDSDVKLTHSHGILLSIGHCLTYEEGQGAFEFKCPYFQLEGHQVSHHEPDFIELPDNISELNDFMCGPMNRKGFLCEECIDDFSISMTSLGYKCSNCTGVWYGIPLDLVMELVPVTAFYLLILMFQIHLTSAPMTSFIFYSQSVMFVIAVDRPPPMEKIIPQYESSFLLNFNLFLYGPWNLDFLRYILPPFCVTNGLRLEHMAILGYVTIFYPLILIFLTWFCIELHGRNFRPIVCLFASFSKCLGSVRKDWGEKRDAITLFSAFILLSYSRLMYQASMLLAITKVTHVNVDGVWNIKYTLRYDYNITYGSSKYIAIAVISILILSAFSILPALLLILYPFRLTRSCLSKCRLDSLCLSAFMDKFHGCYRNGLNGGRDMRSFAGVYFLLRFLPFFYYPCQFYKIPFSFGSYLVLIFLSATLLIAIARPYKETYMNVFDTILLGQLTFIPKMLIDNYYDGMGTQIFITNLIPAFTLAICLLYVRVFKGYKLRCTCTTVTRCWRGSGERNNYKSSHSNSDHANAVLDNMERERIRSETQPLLSSVSDAPGNKMNYSPRNYERID